MEIHLIFNPWTGYGDKLGFTPTNRRLTCVAQKMCRTRYFLTKFEMVLVCFVHNIGDLANNLGYEVCCLCQ